MVRPATSGIKGWIAVLLMLAAGALAALVAFMLLDGRIPNGFKDLRPSPTEVEVDVKGELPPAASPPAAEQSGGEAANAGGQEGLSGDERREREEDAIVAAFEALTDRWMETSEKGVSLADVDAFVRQFAKIPKSRKEESLHRALNLIPDGNVMLLAGILMDKTQDKEIVEIVYNDILNRDENVKKPILLQIYRDRSHPCWADTAWILDITGERPNRK